MVKPIIGLNADFANPSGDKPAFTYVASGYYDAISKVGGVPLIIPPIDSDEDLEQVLRQVDGVVLVGGADLDPRRDGWMLHPTIRPLANRREMFDRRLMRLIAERRTPVFGIGASVIVLDEPLPGWKITATALVITGVAINLLWRPRKIQIAGEAR